MMLYHLGRTIGLFAIGLAFSSCATPQASSFASEKSGKIVGRASGCGQAMLIPSSVRNDAMIAETFGNTEKGSYRVDFENSAALYATAEDGSVNPMGVRTVGCGAYSEFVFSKVPAGTYYVTTAIQRSREGGLIGNPDGISANSFQDKYHYEIGLMERTELDEGGRVRVNLEPEK